MTGALLPLPIVLPLAGAVGAPLLARISGRLPVVVAVVALAGAAGLLVGFVPDVLDGGTVVHVLGGWALPLAVTLTLDPFGLLFALVTAIVGLLLLVYTLSELSGLGARELGTFAALFQLMLAALIGSALTGDLFNLFVWFEVAALASYGLTGFFLERPFALEAAFKILVLTTVAGFSVFVGTGLLYARHGVLNLGQLHQVMGPGDALPVALLLAGYATKAGLVPFHGWLADAHTTAPGPVSALFSGLMVNLGMLALARIGLQMYGLPPVSGLLMVLGLVSALVGAAMALAQDDLKRLLAYDTVSQMGVLAVGVAAGSPAAASGAVFHLLSHALFKALLFLAAGAIVHRTGLTLLSEMGGLGRAMPWVAGAFTVGAASIAGIPPLNGFASLGLIHHGLIEGRQYGIIGLLLVAQVVTVAALGRAGWLAFGGSGPQRDPERMRPGMVVGFGGLAGLCLVLGVLAGPVRERLTDPAAAVLLHATPTRTHVDLWSVPELAMTGGTLALGGALAVACVRGFRPPVGSLRSLHNGSVHDYTLWSVLGTIILAVALALS
jgi:multicomponent Na+:H+ antiporter subunit D